MFYPIFRRGRLLCLGLLLSSLLSVSAQAEQVRLAESYSNPQTFSNETNITVQGKVLTAKTGGGRDELAMESSAQFRFRSRRLPPAGRDASALREVREFAAAQLTTTVGELKTAVQLPADRNLIVSNGGREGIVSYSPQGPLTRETADLLEMPGDVLALVALLPPGAVAAGDEWTPPDWAVQMLIGIEAVDSSELKCRLDQMTSTVAKVVFNGVIKGQKLGATSTIAVQGALLFDLEQQFLSQAKTVYTVKADVGTVNPGLDLAVTATLARRPDTSQGLLTEDRVSSVPLEAPPEDLKLLYQAAPWGIQLTCSRQWHFFNAVYDGPAPNAILRLVELGSLITQCNLSPAPSAPAGTTVPMEQFEADIEKSLGERFGEVVSREQGIDSRGRQVTRVLVSGDVVLKSKQGRADVPMNWIYFLVTDPQGRQASFVFSIEAALLEQLQDRDREIVASLDFVEVRR